MMSEMPALLSCDRKDPGLLYYEGREGRIRNRNREGMGAQLLASGQHGYIFPW